MIKAPKQFISAALGLIMILGGCTGEANEPDLVGPMVSPSFTATIVGAQSRASDTSWDDGDMIGISGDTHTNVCYSYQTGSSFAASNPEAKIYYQEKDTIVFTAYYPYQSLDIANNITKTVTNTEEQTITRQKEFDFLWAQDTGISRKPQVDLHFRHAMAKVVITVKPNLAAGFTYKDMEDAILKLSGIRHTGTFDVTIGIAEADNEVDPEEEWIFSANSNKSEEPGKSITYTLILFPQQFDSPIDFLAKLPTNHLKASIDFTRFNSKYDGDEAVNALVAGRQYNLSITLTRKQLTIQGQTITNWTSVDVGGNATSDDSDDPTDPEED